jgi:hypothetical protein
VKRVNLFKLLGKRYNALDLLKNCDMYEFK